jgi:hypothetical protein
MAEVTQLPLYDRSGVIVAHFEVDATDEDGISDWRWSLNGNGYVWRSINGGKQHIYLHRALVGLERGDRRQCDHIDRDKLNNRRSNLRVATSAQNRQNTPAIGGSSKYRGVHWDKSRGKWAATAQLDRRLHHLGRDNSELEAHQVATEWRKLHMPFSVEGELT